MTFWKNIWSRYRHFLPVVLYMIFYMAVFAYVENRPVYHMHLLTSKFDKLIPFCEAFIIPYMLWFFYISLGVLFFGLIEEDRSQYYSLIMNLFIGMTLFLIISLIWPNGHTIRPAVFPRENIFTSLVTTIYKADTSTNIFPSIHVFNSIAMHTAVAHSKTLKNHPVIVKGSLILCVSIVLSTMFLKQHTLIDVVGAMIFNLITWSLIYQPKKSPQTMQRRTSRKLRHQF